MTTLETLAKRLNKHLTRTVEGEHGELGRLESTGSYTVPVSGTINEVWVRLDGDAARTVTAINLRTAYTPRLPVRLRINTSGRYEVTGLDPLPANTFMGDAAPSANTPPTQGSAVNALWESHQFKPGRVRALNGSDLQVFMEELPFGDVLLGSASGDMSVTVAGITSGKKSWVVVSVNPTTNTLSFTQGTEYSFPIALTKSLAAQIVVPTGDIKLWAYILRSGATYVPVQPQSPDTLYFADLRPWLNIADSTATLQTTDATTTTLASIPVAELQMMTITATINGAKDDYTASIGGTLTAVVRRASGGNVTLVGSTTVVSHEDSAGSPTFDLDVDTGTETARIRVVGIVAETWNWRVRYEMLAS